MDKRLEERLNGIEGKLQGLSGAVGSLGKDLRRPVQAVRDGYYEAALTNAGGILEAVLRDVWIKEKISGKADAKTIEQLFSVIKEQASMDRKTQDYVRDIQLARNRAAHGEEVEAEDCAECLRKLAAILDWYARGYFEAPSPAPGLPATPVPGVVSVRKPGEWSHRHRLALGATAGALLVAAALAVWLWWGRAPKGGVARSGNTIRSIAVLPLANVSGDPAQEFFSDGMTDELITHLSKISALKVISRTSTMQYKDTKKPLKEIAHELGVEGIVEGSVLRSGDRVRITAQLIDASTDTHVWAESYERDLKDILALQGEVARTISGAVNVALTPQEAARLSKTRPVNPEAYEVYLKGMVNWQKLSPQGIEASKGYFDRALEIDPYYAPAYQGLAWYWLVRQVRGLSAPVEAAPKAKAFALRAIELDDSCAEAHAVLATVKGWSDWDWGASEKEWRRALDLDPNSANTHAYYAHFLMITGRAAEAVPHSLRAIELDPANPLYHFMYSGVLLRNRRYDEALEEARAAAAIQPDMGKSWLQPVYILKGMKEEQLAIQRERIAKDPEVLAAFEKGLAGGGYEGAQRAIADVLAVRYEKTGGATDAPGRVVGTAGGIALRYRDAGDYDKAMDWLEKAYEVRDANLAYGMASPIYDPLRSNPRFQALERKMNLPYDAAK